MNSMSRRIGMKWNEQLVAERVFLASEILSTCLLMHDVNAVNVAVGGIGFLVHTVTHTQKHKLQRWRYKFGFMLLFSFRRPSKPLCTHKHTHAIVDDEWSSVLLSKNLCADTIEAVVWLPAGNAIIFRLLRSTYTTFDTWQHFIHWLFDTKSPFSSVDCFNRIFFILEYFDSFSCTTCSIWIIFCLSFFWALVFCLALHASIWEIYKAEVNTLYAILKGTKLYESIEYMSTGVCVSTRFHVN